MRRPFVLGFGIFLLLFLLFSSFFEEKTEKTKQPFPLETGETLPVQAEGTLEKIEKKPNSYHLYFRSVKIIFTAASKTSDNLEYKSDSLPLENEHSLKKRRLPSKIETANLLVTAASFEENFYSLGNIIEIRGMLSDFKKAVNPGMFDEKAYYKENNIYYQIRADALFLKKKNIWYLRNALMSLKNRISNVYDRLLTDTDSGILKAMILGEKNTLSVEIKDLYRINGIRHLLAISGLHITILCMFFYHALNLLRIPLKISFIFTVCFLLCYGYMTGFPVSTSRAVIMMLLLLLARQAGRSYDTLTAMAFSAFFILLKTPHALFSAGFLLSFSAVCGAVFVFPVFSGIFLGTRYEQERKKRKETRRIKEWKKNLPRPVFLLSKGVSSLKHLMFSSFLCSLSVMTATFPVVAFFYYEIPVYSVFLNVLVLLFVSVLVGCAAIGGVTGLFFLPAAKIFLVPVHMILLFYQKCCEFFLNLPKSVFITGCPALFRCFLYFLCLIFLLRSYGKKLCDKELLSLKERIVFFCIIGCAVSFLLYRPGIKGISYTMLDVGQGDGMVLQTESGHTILIDGGSSSVSEVGKYRILPFLKYHGIRKIDLMVMTHEDEDHTSGQIEIINSLKQNGLSVGMYVLPEPSPSSIGENYRIILQAVKKEDIPIRFIHSGDCITLGAARLHCLHPEKGFAADSANAYSTTLFLSYQNFSMLLTGDLEKNGEEQVIEELRKWKYPEFQTGKMKLTVLKIAHHGSKNSTSEELLHLLSPSVSIISCGQKNRYGHPHKELLERLKHIHSRILRTDQSGAIFIKHDGKNWKTETFLK